MNYALVENGAVTNVIWLHPMNASDFPNAAAIGDYAVHIGDAYENGVFFRNGQPVPTMTGLLQAEMTDMRAALNDLGVMVDG